MSKKKMPSDSDQIKQELEAKLKAKADFEKEVSQLKSEKTYLLAEIENQRKSNLKEIEQVAKYANKRLLLKILPIIDNYERALKFSEGSNDKKIESFFAGFSMILDEIKRSLASEGIEEYSPQPFKDVWDSNFCEVLDEIENDDYEKGTILEVAQKGYFLNKRLLVTAKVIVSKKKVKE